MVLGVEALEGACHDRPCAQRAVRSHVMAQFEGTLKISQLQSREARIIRSGWSDWGLGAHGSWRLHLLTFWHFPVLFIMSTSSGVTQLLAGSSHLKDETAEVRSYLEGLWKGWVAKRKQTCKVQNALVALNELVVLWWVCQTQCMICWFVFHLACAK